MLLRISASIVLLISVLFLPFWVSVILGLVFVGYFKLFIEAVFLFLLSDLLYGAKEAKFFEVTFVSFIIAVICFILIESLKKKLR